MPKRIGLGSVSKCTCGRSKACGASGRNVPLEAKGPSKGVSCTSTIFGNYDSPNCLLKLGGAFHCGGFSLGICFCNRLSLLGDNSCGSC